MGQVLDCCNPGNRVGSSGSGLDDTSGRDSGAREPSSGVWEQAACERKACIHDSTASSHCIQPVVCITLTEKLTLVTSVSQRRQ